MPRHRKRIVISKPGGYDRFTFDDTPIENPPPGKVQVDIRACGINFADVAVRLGLYAAAKDMYPLCPGLEFAGIVRAIGDNVQSVKPGDRVFGVSRFGGYSTVINGLPQHLWKLPDGWDFNQGAAFPVAYLTAFYALYEIGQLKKTDQVLVHSAAGGVGTALLNLLKINGNVSVGVVGTTEKISAAKAAGATFVIDKQTDDLWKRAKEINPQGYDIILDANGASTLKNSYCHLKPAGRLLIYGFASMFSHSGRKNYLKLLWYYVRTPRFNPFDLTGSNKTISGFNLVYLFSKVKLFQDIMKTLTDLDSQGKIVPSPITQFHFEDVAKAHQAIESGKSIGKLVLVV